MCAGARRARTRINSLHVPEIICKFGQKTKRAAYEWNIKKEVHTHTHSPREGEWASLNQYLYSTRYCNMGFILSGYPADIYVLVIVVEKGCSQQPPIEF